MPGGVLASRGLYSLLRLWGMQQNPGCFQPTMFIQHVQKPGRIVISFGTRPFIDSEHFLIKSRYQCFIRHMHLSTAFASANDNSRLSA